jgi:hypothetical protein
MDSVRIDLDGRFTFWRSKKFNPRRPVLFSSPESEAWVLFCYLSPEKRAKYLLFLGLSHDTSSDKNLKPPVRKGRGTRGITNYGRRLVRNGAQWLEDNVGLKNLSFLTLTLPTTVLAELDARVFSELLNRMSKKLAYHLGRGGLCPLVVGCVELHKECRSEAPRQPPVHIHLLFQGRRPMEQWAFRPDQYQAWWLSSVQSLLACNQEFQSSVRVEMLRSSSVSYLGKYMSKGAGRLNQSSYDWLPTAWYTISTKLKALVKAAEFKCTGELASALYEWLYREDLCLWARLVRSPESEIGISYTLAWIGQIRTRSDYWWIVRDSREYLAAQ